MSRIDTTSKPVALRHEGPGKWHRRALSISICASVWLLITGLAPLLFGLLLIADLLRNVRFAGVRMLAFLWLFLSCELSGVLCAFGLWLVKLVWPGVTTREYQSWHFALQRWWAGILWWGTSTFFSLDLVVEGDDCAAEGPYLLMIRHTSVADSLLASICLGTPHKMELRYVLKRELLWDPSLDVVGHRLPNVFIGRGVDDAADSLAQITRLAEGLGPKEGVLLYPEGTRYTAKKRARILDKLSTAAAAGDEGAAAQLAYASELNHVLPPRPKGTLALREAQPDLDVVFCVHVGFEEIVSLWHLWHGKHIGGMIRVGFWRVRAEDIPKESAACVTWLNEEWRKVDAWVEAQEV